MRCRRILKRYSPSRGNVWRTARPPCVGERQPAVHARVLPRPGGHGVEMRCRPIVRTRQRQTTDLRRRRHVARHQGRRNRQHVGIVVESETGQVAGQEISAVNFQRQQIAHRVDVFGAVQATRGHAPGSHRRGCIQCRFERAGKAGDRRGVRTAPAFRRHLSVAQLADDFLEGLRVRRNVPDVQRLQRQTSGQQPIVVAGNASTGRTGHDPVPGIDAVAALRRRSAPPRRARTRP